MASNVETTGWSLESTGRVDFFAYIAPEDRAPRPPPRGWARDPQLAGEPYGSLQGVHPKSKDAQLSAVAQEALDIVRAAQQLGRVASVLASLGEEGGEMIAGHAVSTISS